MPRKVTRRRMRVGLGGFLTAALMVGAGASSAQAVTLIRSDADFILTQIKIAENHAGGGELRGPGPNQVSNPLFGYGLRTVDGRDNNLHARPAQVRRGRHRLHSAEPGQPDPRRGAAVRPRRPRSGPGRRPDELPADQRHRQRLAAAHDQQPDRRSDREQPRSGQRGGQQTMVRPRATTTTTRPLRTFCHPESSPPTRVFPLRTTRGSRCSASSSTTASTSSPRAATAR